MWKRSAEKHSAYEGDFILLLFRFYLTLKIPQLHRLTWGWLGLWTWSL